MLIRGFENKSELDKSLDNVLDQVKEEGIVGSPTPQTKQGQVMFHKGFFLQALSPDGVKWKGWARPKHLSVIQEFESQWHLTERDAMKELIKTVDIYTK